MSAPSPVSKVRITVTWHDAEDKYLYSEAHTFFAPPGAATFQAAAEPLPQPVYSLPLSAVITGVTEDRREG